MLFLSRDKNNYFFKKHIYINYEKKKNKKANKII